MTTEELLKQLYDATLVGNGPEVLSLNSTSGCRAVERGKVQ